MVRDTPNPDAGLQYRYSLTPLRDGDKYTLVCSRYDCNTFTGELKSLFPSKTWSAQPYPTSYATTALIRTYIETYLPC